MAEKCVCVCGWSCPCAVYRKSTEWMAKASENENWVCSTLPLSLLLGFICKCFFFFSFSTDIFLPLIRFQFHTHDLYTFASECQIPHGILCVESKAKYFYTILVDFGSFYSVHHIKLRLFSVFEMCKQRSQYSKQSISDKFSLIFIRSLL